MIRLLHLLLWAVLSTVRSELKCLNTSLLCNKTCLNDSIAETSKCKISKFNTINSEISLPESYYTDTESGNITLESFEVYMKGSHSQQQDLIIDLIHGNISFRLADYGKNGIPNFDVTISDDSNKRLDSQILGLSCKCTIKPVAGNMKNEFNKNVELNKPYVLQISDSETPDNGTFQQWCIKKFCYEKITQNPTLNPTIYPTLYPTQSPNTLPPKIVNNSYYSLFDTRGILIIVGGIIILVIIIGISCLCYCCYKCHITKQRTKTQTQTNDIIKISKPNLTLVTTQSGFDNNYSNQSIQNAGKIKLSNIEKVENSLDDKITTQVKYNEDVNYLNDEQLYDNNYESSKEGKIKQQQNTEKNDQINTIELQNRNYKPESRRTTIEDTYYR